MQSLRDLVILGGKCSTLLCIYKMFNLYWIYADNQVSLMWVTAEIPIFIVDLQFLISNTHTHTSTYFFECDPNCSSFTANMQHCHSDSVHLQRCKAVLSSEINELPLD